MAEAFARLMEDLERERVGAPGPRCLSDATLEGLADGSLAQADVAAATRHLSDCLQCLHAYASLRSLLDPTDLTESATIAPAAGTQRVREEGYFQVGWMELARRAITWRVPAGWAMATAAAAVVMTWMISISIDRPGVFPSPGPMDPTNQPSRMTGLSDRSDGSRRTVTGTVERVQETTSAGIETYVVTVKDGSGATYIVFGWGRPSVRTGQSVQATGVFTSIGGSGSAQTYKGVASDLRVIAGR